MDNETTIGDRLRRARREQGMTQEQLADRAGLSRELIAKMEQGRRPSVRLTTLTRLAQALDLPLSELADNRPRLDGDREGGSILAIRDVLLSPALLPGIDPGADAVSRPPCRASTPPWTGPPAPTGQASSGRWPRCSPASSARPASPGR